MWLYLEFPEMAMYRAVVNLVDNTITTVLTKWGGFSPQLAVVVRTDQTKNHFHPFHPLRV